MGIAISGMIWVVEVSLCSMTLVVTAVYTRPVLAMVKVENDGRIPNIFQ